MIKAALFATLYLAIAWAVVAVLVVAWPVVLIVGAWAFFYCVAKENQ